MSKELKVQSKFQPAGDQPTAIKGLVEGINDGLMHQTLLGVTGSGKTFTIANVISILIWAGVLFGTAFMLGQRFAEDMQAYMWWAMPVALVLFVLGQRRIRQSMEEGAELDEGAQRLSRS